MPAKRGLYSNIAAKRRRIKAQKAAGKTPERMRKPGTKGAPTAKAFKAAAKTAKKKPKKKDSSKMNKFLKKLGVEEEVKEKPKFEIDQ